MLTLSPSNCKVRWAPRSSASSSTELSIWGQGKPPLILKNRLWVVDWLPKQYLNILGQLGLIIGTITKAFFSAKHSLDISESCGCFTKTIIIKFETWLADWVIFRLNACLEHRKSSHLDSGHQNWAPLPWCIFITKYSYQHVVVSQSFSSFSYQNGHNMMVSSIFPDYWATRALVCCSMWWAYSWQLLWPWHHSKPRPEGLEWKAIFQLSSSQR